MCRSLKIPKKSFYKFIFFLSGRRIWTYFESTPGWTNHYNRVTTDLEGIAFISIQIDCWKTVSSSTRSKITFTNIVRLTICSLNMILESGACLDVRFNDWTQVIHSSRRQGIPMTFLARPWINYVVPIFSSLRTVNNLESRFWIWLRSVQWPETQARSKSR